MGNYFFSQKHEVKAESVKVEACVSKRGTETDGWGLMCVRLCACVSLALLIYDKNMYEACLVV